MWPAHCEFLPRRRPIKAACTKQAAQCPWNSYEYLFDIWPLRDLFVFLLFSAKLCKWFCTISELKRVWMRRQTRREAQNEEKIIVIRSSVGSFFLSKAAAFNLWLQFSSIKLFSSLWWTSKRMKLIFQDQDCVKSRVSFRNESDYVSQQFWPKSHAHQQRPMHKSKQVVKLWKNEWKHWEEHENRATGWDGIFKVIKFKIALRQLEFQRKSRHFMRTNFHAFTICNIWANILFLSTLLFILKCCHHTKFLN